MSKPKILIVLLASLVCYITLLYAPAGALFQNQYDDSYITYRYAINLATGHGLVFNYNDLTDSASSFLYTIVLAASYAVGITNLEVMGALIGITSAVGICYLVYTSCFLLTKKVWLSFVLGLLTGMHGYISGWAISGMESVLFTFLVTLFIYLYYFKKSERSLLITLVLIAVLLTRIEGILLIGVWFIHEAYRVYKKKKSAKIFLLQCSAIALVTFLLYFFKYAYYGTLLSNAVAFKRIATYYQSNPQHFVMVWTGTSLVIVLLSAYAIFKKLLKVKEYWSLYVYIVLSVVSFLLGPHSDGARYSIHILPVLIVFAAVTIASLQKRKKKILVVLVLSLLIFQTLASSFAVRHFMVALSQGQACRHEVGLYVKEHAKDTYVLSGDIGMIAYTAPKVQFIDLSGLTSQDVLHQYQKKESLDPLFVSKKPAFLADSFFVQADGSLDYPLLLNKTNHIKDMSTYSEMFSKKLLAKPLMKCNDGERAYGVVDIRGMYK